MTYLSFCSNNFNGDNEENSKRSKSGYLFLVEIGTGSTVRVSQKSRRSSRSVDLILQRFCLFVT